MRVSKELNSKNIKVTLDVLGEFIKTPEEADVNKKEYLNLIDITLKTVLMEISRLNQQALVC